MRSFRRFTAIVTGLALAGSALAACGDDSESSGKGLENGGKITVAALPLIDAAPLYIAQKQKFFENEGVKLTIKPVQQSIQALPALKKGDVDVVNGNYVTFLQAADQGALKLSVLAEGAIMSSNMMALLVKPDSPIKEPKDLEGKTVAVNILNNIQSITFDAIMKAKNVDPKKIKYKAIPFPQMAAALQKGDIDAVHMGEPFVSDLQKKQGARIVVDGGSQPVTDMPVSGYLSTQEFASENPKLAAAFQRAMMKAQQVAASDRKKVEEVLPGYAHITPEVASVITLPGFPTSNNPTRMTRIADLMSAAGLLKQKPDMKTVLFTPPAS